MNGPRPLRLCHAKGVADERRDVAGIYDLFRGFCEWAHHRDRIDDLKLGLPALKDRLLAGNHKHWHATKGRMGRRGHEVGRAGPERAQAHPRFTRKPPIGRRHETGDLLMAGHHTLMREVRRDSSMSRFSSPGTPKTYSTPSFSRARTKISEPLIA